MKNQKILTIIAVVITASILTFTACGKDTEPVTSDAVEETVEETVEPEEPEVSDDTSTTSDQGINEGVAIDRETSTSEGSSSNENIAGTGYDSKTDEEIAEELEEMESAPKEISQEEDIAQATDENGNFEPRKLTNGGKGYDLGGVHYETRGEYLDALAELDANDPNAMTWEEWNAIDF